MSDSFPTLAQCGCGFVLAGEDFETLRLEADGHVRRAHPELVGTLSPLELARPRRGCSRRSRHARSARRVAPSL